MEAYKVWRGLVLAAAALATWAAFDATVQPAEAAVPYRTITSTPGPLKEVIIGSDLSCQVLHGMDNSNYQFYQPDTRPGDCGTFFLDGDATTGTFYAPDFGNHELEGGGTGFTATAAIGSHQSYTLIEQSEVTGSGTWEDPWTIITEVQAGPLSGITLIETNEYVEGDEYYTTTVEVKNRDTLDHQFRLWRAADCYLGGSDSGYGYYDPDTGDIACSVNPNNNPPGRIELWHPHTPGSNYFHQGYSTVWSQIGSKGDFPNSCICTTLTDNGAGLQWGGVIKAGDSAKFKHDTVFSLDGILPRPPTASFTFDNSRDTCMDSRILFKSTSFDKKGIRSLSWDFGDGTTSSFLEPEHVYAQPGEYTVRLTVVNVDGLSHTVSHKVKSVGDPNCCPTLKGAQSINATEGDYLHFRIGGDDYEGDGLTYVLKPRPSDRSHFDARGGVFRWPSVRGEAGTYNITLAVDDGRPHLDPCPPAQVLTIRLAPLGSQPPVADTDMDGVADRQDNCPSVPNPLQADSDRDGVGDACTAGSPGDPGSPGVRPPQATPGDDTDGDGVEDLQDNCPAVANREQSDIDRDLLGDACDQDLDGDGMVQFSADPKTQLDNCPADANADQLDHDRDGVGDACDALTLLGGARVIDHTGWGTGAEAEPVAEPSRPLLQTQAASVAGAALLTLVVAATVVAFVLHRAKR